MIRGFRWLPILALIAVTPLGGCLYRSHAVAHRSSMAPLQTATLNELIERINSGATKIQTLNATVNVSISEHGSKRGKITKYQEIYGYILVRKPAFLRVIGLFPLVQNRVFDIVSNDQQFKLWIPARNQFITGNNTVSAPSTQPFAGLRPQAIYDALLLRPIDLQNEIVVQEQSDSRTVTDPKTLKLVQQPDYLLNVIAHIGQKYYLSRKTLFDRTDMQPYEQIIYNECGAVMTDVWYYEYKEFEGVLFPTNIRILFPQEAYSVELKVMKLSMNAPITDEQFVLETPPGVHLGLE